MLSFWRPTIEPDKDRYLEAMLVWLVCSPLGAWWLCRQLCRRFDLPKHLGAVSALMGIQMISTLPDFLWEWLQALPEPLAWICFYLGVPLCVTLVCGAGVPLCALVLRRLLAKRTTTQ